MRPDRDLYFLVMAYLAATRSTCLRRHVGCVLVNARGHVLATGYNGVAAGAAHCNLHDPFHETGYPHACVAAFAASGMRVDECEAVHAEQNALLQCRDVWSIEVCYVTTAPCMSCTKLLLNTACQRIIYGDDYVTSGLELWQRLGRESKQLDAQLAWDAVVAAKHQQMI